MKIISIVLIASFPLEIELHRLISFDFNYTRKNHILGRDSIYFSVRSYGLYVQSIIYFAITYLTSGNTSNSDFNITKSIVINGYSFGISILLCIYRIQDGAFFFTSLRLFYFVLDSFVFTESLMSFAKSCVNTSFDEIDLDLYFLLISGMCTYFLHNISEKEIVNLLANGSQFQKTREKSLYYLEYLYYTYINNEKSTHKLHLVQMLTSHTQKCADPYCMCFELKLIYDSTNNINSTKVLFQLRRAAG